MWRKRLSTYRDLGIVIEGEKKPEPEVAGQGKCLL